MHSEMRAKPLSGKRIGVFGKGGSGKSTVTVLLAQTLCQQGYPVCVLDADSTNLGIYQLFEVQDPPSPLVEYFGGMVFSGGAVTCPVDDPTPLPNAQVSLEDLPAEYFAQSPGGILLFTAGKIGDRGPGAGCDGPIAKIARDFRISVPGEPPVTLVDFKAGFEDSARGALTSLDAIIVVIDPTMASLELASSMKQMVEQIKADVLPATSHLESSDLIFWANKYFVEARIDDVWFVLNRIQSKEEQIYLSEKLRDKGIEPLGVISQDPAIALSWLKGVPIHAEGPFLAAKKILDKLETYSREKQVEGRSNGGS